MQREMTKTEIAKYQQNGNCPFCGNDSVNLNYDSGEFSGPHFSQEVYCSECDSTWYDIYKETGVTVCVDGTGHDYDFPAEPDQPAPVPPKTEGATNAIRQALAPIIEQDTGQAFLLAQGDQKVAVFLNRKQLDAIRALVEPEDWKAQEQQKQNAAYREVKDHLDSIPVYPKSVPAETEKTYTVFATYEENGQPYTTTVTAASPQDIPQALAGIMEGNGYCGTVIINSAVEGELDDVMCQVNNGEPVEIQIGDEDEDDDE